MKKKLYARIDDLNYWLESVVCENEKAIIKAEIASIREQLKGMR